MKCQLTLASKENVAELVKLINLSYRTTQSWTHEANLVAGHRVTAAHIEALLADDDGQLLVVKLASETVACIFIKIDEGCAVAGTFAVHPDHQCAGLGSEVLSMVEKRVLNRGISRLAVEVLSPRTELIKYYERRGFNAVGKASPYPLTADVGRPIQENIGVLRLEKQLLGVLCESNE